MADGGTRGASRAGGSARALALAATLVGAACTRPMPIKVGMVTGLSGRHYDLGLSSRNGVELAAAEINAAGGVRGRPIELLVRDDGQNPEQARRAVTELIQSGVVALIGHATSSMVEATLPIVDREHVLMVSPTASAATFLEKDDWLVMMYPSTRDSGHALASYVARHAPARRIAAIYDLSNRLYTQSWVDAFRASLEAAGRTVRPVSFTSGQAPSMGAVAEAALAGGTEAVVVVANAFDTAALCQQVRLRSRSVPLFGAEWGFTNDVVANGGKAMEGAVFVQKVNVGDTSPRYLAFREAYRARYRRPDDFASMIAYEAMRLVAGALERDASREGVRDALLGIGTFQGLQGPVHIDRFGDVERRHYIMAIRSGQVVLVE